MVKILFFWKDRWLGDVSLRDRFKWLFDFIENKWLTLADMFPLG